MIKGIGIDLVDLKRLKEISDERFIHRILSDDELKFYQTINDDSRKLTYLGGRFAAKEAIFKAVSKGDKTAYYKDFSILNNEDGKPYVISKHLSLDLKVHISITHTSEQAVAYVIIEE